MAFTFPNRNRQRARGRPPISGHAFRWRRLAGPGIVVLAAAAATAPQLVRGNSCGHDFDFHLVSWFDCLNAWRHGTFYPHWAPSANFGAGEPRFVFYPPLTWMLGAALGLVLPWHLVPIALTFVLLAATGLATRALARQTLASAPATLAGCTALFSGYALFTAYERSAFGELAGGFWIPLLLIFASQRAAISAPGNWVKSRFASTFATVLNGQAGWLTLVVAGSWLSNAPVGVMASYLLAAVAVLLALLYRAWTPILRAGLATLLGLGLSAFYLVPAAWEQRWVDIRQATDDPGERIENSFLFGRHANPALQLHDVELHRVSWIGICMIAFALAGLLLVLRRKTMPAEVRRWLPLALTPVGVLLLQLPISLPLWNLLPKLRFLQFPWRWLVAVEAPFGIFFAAAIWPRISAPRWLRVAVPAVCAAFFIGMTFYAAQSFFQPCDEEDAVAPMLQVFRLGGGFEGTDEYAPPDADNSVVATGLPDACFVTDPDTTLGVVDTVGANPDWWVEQHTCEATFVAVTQAANGRPEHFEIRAIMPADGYLILRLRSYPAWRVRMNGAEGGPIPQRDDGLIDVAVPKGSIDLTVDWETTTDVVIGRSISVAALVSLLALWWVERGNRI